MAKNMRLRWFMMLVISTATLVLLFGASSASAATSLQQSATTLIAIRAASHSEGTPQYDRVVFELSGSQPSNITIEYVSKLIADGSGRVIAVKGNSILHVVFSPASAHTNSGKPTVAARQSYNLPLVKEVVSSGDFEGTVSYGIGVSRKAEIRVLKLTSPTRIVIDFLHT